MSATQGPHSLAFRVMRLCKPSFHVDPPLRIDPFDLLAGEDFSDDPSSASLFRRHVSSADVVDSDLTYRNRFLLNHPTDPIGLSGLLLLPQSFGFSLISRAIRFSFPNYIVDNILAVWFVFCCCCCCAERSISEKHSVAISASTIVRVPKFGMSPLRFHFPSSVL